MNTLLGTAVLTAALLPSFTHEPASFSNENGCGRIEVRDLAPRQQQLYGATLVAIDGDSPGPTGTTTFRVPAGPHTLTVAERIDSRQIPFSDVARNGRRETHRTLDVDVKRDTTYFLAARLMDGRARNDPDRYWVPVLWKETPERCGPPSA